MSLNGHFLGALCAVGTVGNLVALVTLQHVNDSDKNSTNWLLRALAVVDTLYLLTRLLANQFEFFTCRDVQWLPLAVSRLFAAIAPYMASGASLIHMVSVWTVVVIAADRYITVCLPGEVQLRTVRRAKVVVACVVVASVVCCAPLFVDSSLECDDAKSVAIASPVLVKRSWWLVTYHIACDCLIRTLIPFVILLVLIGRMLVRVRRMTRKFCTKREPANKLNKVNWRKNLTGSLVAVVGLFICCQLPQLLLRVSILLLQLSGDLHVNEDVLQQASNVASGLLVVNATANFFVYCAIGNTFRRVLLLLVKCRFAKTPNQNQKNEVQLPSISKPTKAANK